MFHLRFKSKFSSFLDLSLHGGTSSSWQSFTVSVSTVTGATGSKICSFHLMYLSKERMNLNGKKWLVDSRADIVIRCNSNLVRQCQLVYITWLFVFNIGNSLHSLMGWKCMDNKFQALSNFYFDAGYLKSFIYLENVVMLFPLVI